MGQRRWMMTLCLDVVGLLGLVVYKSRGDYLINVPLLCRTFLEFQLKNVLRNEQNYDMILRDILFLFVDGGASVLSLYPCLDNMLALWWICGTYVLGMWQICSGYVVWVCGMCGDSGCGYVVVEEELVGISPGACDRLSVVVVVVERTHSHTRPSAAPTPPQPHILNLNQPLKKAQNARANLCFFSEVQ